MKRYRQFESVLISDFVSSEWKHPVHNHNHHELIYIKYGKGVHHINQLPISYEGGDVFFLGPDEDHFFIITETTRFVYIKFTDVYVYQKGGSNEMIRNLEYLIKSRETHLSKFNLVDEDRHSIGIMFDAVISLKHDIPGNENLIWFQTISIAGLLQRNMPELKSVLNNGRDMQALFCYIHKYIYTPENLKANVMAEHFNFAKDYIGPYFKKNSGITLRQYISDYRKGLIKQRISSGRYGLKQIAQDFGLTDESHVLKLLKK